LLASPIFITLHAGQELRSTGGACTSAQLRNITLCNQLQEVSRSIASFLPRLPPQAAALLRSPPPFPLPKQITSDCCSDMPPFNTKYDGHMWGTDNGVAFKVHDQKGRTEYCQRELRDSNEIFPICCSMSLLVWRTVRHSPNGMSGCRRRALEVMQGLPLPPSSTLRCLFAVSNPT